MAEHSVTETPRLKGVALDFESRQAAERLVDAVIEDPRMAAYEITWLREENARLNFQLDAELKWRRDNCND